MSAPDLADLVARVEAADGPSRELDAEIACAHRGLEPILLTATGDEAYGAICDPGDSGYGTANRCTRGFCYARFPDEHNPPTLGGGKRGNAVQGFAPPHYTASLDATMTLVPEGSAWELTRMARSHALIFDPWAEAAAATPALALCAAALRARQQKE